MLVNLALVIIALISLFLAWHPKYEDGFMGRLALGGLVLICVIILVGEGRGIVHYTFALEIQCILLFVALFLLRHCYRFVLWAYWGSHAWPPREPQKAE